MGFWDGLGLREHLWQYQRDEECSRLVGWPPVVKRGGAAWLWRRVVGWACALLRRSDSRRAEPQFGGAGRVAREGVAVPAVEEAAPGGAEPTGQPGAVEATTAVAHPAAK